MEKCGRGIFNGNTEKKTIFVSNNTAGVCRGHITRCIDINFADFLKVA